MNLIIPQYLNQKIVFDMLAILEDGFSQMSTVNKVKKENSELNSEIGGELGTSNVFSLFNIKLKSGISTKSGEGTDQSETLDKVHTPVSLFEKLLSSLESTSQIIEIENADSLNMIEIGSFVRMSGKLSKNPIVNIIESFIKIMELISIFDDSSKTNKTKGKIDNSKSIINQMKGLGDSLVSGNMVDLVCNSDDSNVRAVLPVYFNYFFNQNMNEIIDGEYRVIGKVIKIVKENDENIDLLRNTSFSTMKKTLFDELFQAMNTPEIEQFFDFPEIESSIGGPAVMIIPIAIYI